MKRKTEYESPMTPEEKELLRQLMEEPGIESEYDFFKDLQRNIPPPEYFMRGEPDRPRRWPMYVGAAVIAIAAGVFVWRSFIL